ncbi:unnamed protein product [Rotaria sp. Silwood2]|nr:unnamed protein product [Rotaria sp. Silwood2]CAF2559877.1 unnamed protein product [Rotaria sp. Silwood2]CAF2821230.1 unnamed protein product [Rotaria sp. Silwood2]CAF2982422.1 unnamed protein product [Rotaria sp. Silwood2]CAF3988384.1 unnamed protein product [Rotaria sp. Silwood2]
MGNSHSAGGGSTLKKHIETATKTGVLQYDNKKLKEISPGLCLPNLRTLSVNDNELQTIPMEISLMVNLKNLSLRNNQIVQLPDCFGQLKKLENIQLGQNQLRSLPSSFANLSSLRQLIISNNRFTTIPESILKLTNLQLLDLSSNQITQIPDQIQTIQVDELNLNDNRITKISENIRFCPRLRTLRLDRNNLALDIIPTSLLTDSNLSLLSYDGNRFDEKAFQGTVGYDQYMQRFTASRRKLE